jgi:hypothetical protein
MIRSWQLSASRASNHRRKSRADRVPSCLVIIVFALFIARQGHSSGTRDRVREITDVATFVKLAVVLSKVEFGFGENIFFRYEMRNTSGQDLWLNARMSSGPRGVPEELREIALEVRDEKGTMAKYSCFDKRTRALAGDYRILRSGETLVIDARLRCYHLPPGRYTLNATYHDGNSVVPRAPDGVLYFSEEIVAPTISFNVVSHMSPSANSR